ncbi:DUF3693 domain-containing protein [Vibrio marisflavi]|uniref:Uncharacterized protein n=1 Tax=Vibrio marisflavi CECT 7928 TaxID=634439 RepID=A0ABM9A552_9VIBR|nr:DUF3693 domain-containing protein [Vibrio marisflavi]CAH0539819.1 hypothetical protein VMF7928_02474 [Vibrio marisflavi CECT 7928]
MLDAYKEAKRYVQDKQIAHDLNLPRQRIGEMRNGERHLTENEALFLAEHIGMPEEEVLVYLAADRSKDHRAQRAWESIAKKFNGQGLRAISMASAGLALVLMPDFAHAYQCALCVLMLNLFYIKPLNERA